MDDFGAGALLGAFLMVIVATAILGLTTCAGPEERQCDEDCHPRVGQRIGSACHCATDNGWELQQVERP